MSNSKRSKRTGEEVLNWLKAQGYQTERDSTGEHLMFFDLDMPEILNDFLEAESVSEEKSFKRGDFCDDAKETITNKRTVYGKPEDNFKNIAEQWCLYLKQKYGVNVELTSVDVAVMMIDLKKCRNMKEYKRDNTVDTIGYAALQGELEEAPLKYNGKVHIEDELFINDNTTLKFDDNGITTEKKQNTHNKGE